jgi:hypothetical protein
MDHVLCTQSYVTISYGRRCRLLLLSSYFVSGGLIDTWAGGSGGTAVYYKLGMDGHGRGESWQTL